MKISYKARWAIGHRVGYRLNLNDSNFDSACRFQFLLISNFDSNKVKKNKKT